jgi:predicted small integral membrane protein
MIETRIVKIVMVGSLALFAGLVTFDNLTDYQTNYAFVRHVLSMDATPPGSALMYRSISSSSLWEAAYALIIAGEGATALGFAGAALLPDNPGRADLCHAEGRIGCCRDGRSGV